MKSFEESAWKKTVQGWLDGGKFENFQKAVIRRRAGRTRKIDFGAPAWRQTQYRRRKPAISRSH